MKTKDTNETEVIVLSTTDALVSNLEKENITEVVIADLKKKYSDLKITGLDDKEGYKAVDKARLDVKQKRIIAEKICNVFVSEAHAIHKSRTAKRTEIVSKFTEIEKQLESKQAVIDNEIARLKSIEDEKKKQITAKRIADLQAVNFKGDFLIIEFLSDDQFTEKLSSAKFDFEQEQNRIAEEKRLAQVEADRLEKQRKDQEARERELQRQEQEAIEKAAKIKAEQEAEQNKINTERELLAVAVKQKRNEELRPYIVFIRNYSELIAKDENEYQKEFAEIKKGAELQWESDRKQLVIESLKREEEEKIQAKIAQDKIESDKKEAIELALKQVEEKRILDAKHEEERIEVERLESIRLENLKSEKQKLTEWVNGFQIDISVDLSENKTVKEIFSKFESFKNWSKEQISNLK